MTLALQSGVEVKTYPAHLSKTMRFGGVEVLISDFMAAAYYVLVNTPIEDEDVRLKFVDAVKKLEVAPAFGGQCLTYPGIQVGDSFTQPF
jgi:hypothetical protein